MKRNHYILHFGGANTGKALLLETDHRSGSKAFWSDAEELYRPYGFQKPTTVERTKDGTTRHFGPCHILNA